MGFRICFLVPESEYTSWEPELKMTAVDTPAGALVQGTQVSRLRKPSDSRVLPFHAAEAVVLKLLGLALRQQSCRHAKLIPLARYFRSSLDFSTPPRPLP